MGDEPLRVQRAFAAPAVGGAGCTRRAQTWAPQLLRLERDCDALDLAVVVQRLYALLAPVSAVLKATKRGLNGSGSPRVHKYLASFELLAHGQRAGHVVGPKAGHQTEVGVVRDRDGFVVGRTV
jgi:hypothetical protein